MDYFSHGLWSYVFFHRIKRPVLAIIFGLLPDTLSWGIYLFYRLFTGHVLGRPQLGQIPAWVFMLYNISHSIFVAAAVIAVVWAILKRFPIYMLAWPIAILMDIPTHTRWFLPTPFLWPFSDWRFPGISWGNRTFMLINYCLILVSLIVILVLQKRKNGRTKIN